ncbi:hypothetical protein [Haloplanus aerogenes]|uniref:Lipoprotein n=1 Tax=Haloplanus aerogenes TaxID=660522 RepID=A0A3M0DDX1_9EURY|nr:hypothetical protein [Haloplanus aerogenes]AZH26109.1 hypothetical protein DU502_12400 [Haloplanus aerogenes]RMB18440.1 hypothetical protein ATH50_1896 [Haloplanus aerogenes]
MSFTRRGILAAVALAQSNLLGGCFGGDTDSTQANPESGGSGATATATQTSEPTTGEPTATETPTATPTPTPVANADLAAATADIFSEFEWFRTQYGPTMTQFRVTVGDVYDTITEIQAADDRTEADVQAFRSASTDLASFVQSNLSPHFQVAPALRVGNNVYVRDFERGVARDDRQLQDSALSRARSFYQRVRSNQFISNELSRRPIYGPLYDMLIPSGATDRIVALVSEDDDFVTWAHPDLDDSTANDGVDQHTHEFPSGHRVFTHAHEHPTSHPIRDHTNEPELNELYAYGADGVGLLVDGASYRERLDDFEPALTNLFGPIKSEGRTAGVTLFVGTASAGWDSSPVYVEQFDSVDAAQAATESTDAVGSEGVTSLAGRDWERVFYDASGTTIYAYRLRAGTAVVTALPLDIPWERRPEWAAGLAGTWLAAE